MYTIFSCETISRLANLRSISLFKNNFSGGITRDFGKCSPSLGIVTFSNNSFIGEMLQDICSDFALGYLAIDGNNFTKLPLDCLRNFPGLTRVRLDSNQFTTDIMSAFRPNLDFISLSNSQFVGNLSAEWGECMNLTNLLIDGNKIASRISSELRKLSQLHVLTSYGNELTRKILDEMGNLGELIRLNLSNNHLVGDITTSLENLSKLDYLVFRGEGIER